MVNGKATFEEIGRVKASPTTDVVVSAVSKPAPTPDNMANTEIIGININSWIVSPKYTGPTKGTFVPNDKIGEFTKLINSIGV